ncbi:MAG: helix-turn-helix domain-containing protein [Candidatus Margulisbacteria bacterium]|nr:helix-turn-helix domain-containing protein [Candidatus Margulisiibacteriota bacterium]
MNLDKDVFELSDLFIREHEGQLYHALVESLEKPLISRVLEQTAGNQLQAARILGINRNTLRSKIRKLGIYVR